MENIKRYIKVVSLVCREWVIGLSDVEQQELNAWRGESPEHERAMDALKIFDVDLSEKRYGEVDADQEWMKFNKRLHKKSRFLKQIMAVAASICLLVMTGGLYWLFNMDRAPVSFTLAKQEQQNYVRLIQSDGQTINISDKQGNVKLDGDARLYDDNRLEYSKNDSSDSRREMEYNTLIIPKGAFYHLILADGTKVWLNSDSKIKYPVIFGEEKRVVILSGEAYFEVAKDTIKPFIVKADRLDVKVLGTVFNVNTYGDAGKIFLVLLEGMVEVSAGQGESRIVIPGQKAELDTYNAEAGIQVVNCDVEQYIGWKEGQFCFRNISLTEILKRISRYYDVTVIYEQGYEEEYYTGEISHHVSLEALLSVIEFSTSVSFTVEHKIVYIKKKKRD